MNDIHFSVIIDAPREKVWNAMLGDVTYREWTKPFNPAGSYFEGTWEKGSKIKFLGVNPETGREEGGMYAEIAENRPYEFVSIKHLGEIKADGTEMPSPESTGFSFENYTLNDLQGKTEVVVDCTGIPGEYLEMLSAAWPQALEKLKEISEK